MRLGNGMLGNAGPIKQVIRDTIERLRWVTVSGCNHTVRRNESAYSTRSPIAGMMGRVTKLAAGQMTTLQNHGILLIVHGYRHGASRHPANPRSYKYASHQRRGPTLSDIHIREYVHNVSNPLSAQIFSHDYSELTGETQESHHLRDIGFNVSNPPLAEIFSQYHPESNGSSESCDALLRSGVAQQNPGLQDSTALIKIQSAPIMRLVERSMRMDVTTRPELLMTNLRSLFQKYLTPGIDGIFGIPTSRYIRPSAHLC